MRSGWLFDLAFLADFTRKLRDTNLELQGKRNFAEIMSTVSSYKREFELMMPDLTNNFLYHFPNMQHHQKKYRNLFSDREVCDRNLFCYPIFWK
jgi:hypothetical protein